MAEEYQIPEDAPLLDREQALQNVEEDQEFLREILDIFLEEIPERIDLFRNTIKVKDYNQLTSAAHSLKGVSLTIGAISCHLLAKNLEDAARAEDESGINELYPRLEETLREIEAELSNSSP